MRFLAIETSTPGGKVATGEGPTIRAVETLDAGRRHARDLLPAIQRVCNRAGWRVCDIECVVVDIGPGSYTGLRVGLMAAKTLAYANQARLVGVDAMTILLADNHDCAGSVHAIVDAQQSFVYAARRDRLMAGAGDARATKIEVLPYSQWLAGLREGDLVTGPALDRHAATLPTYVCLADAEDRNPAVERLYALGVERNAGGQSDDFWTIEPLYLRPSSAQLKWDARIEASQLGSTTTPIAKPS